MVDVTANKIRGVRIENREVHMSLSMAAKVGSVIVHADESASDAGHEFDLIALKSLLNDDEVRAFIEVMGPFVPRKR